MGNNNTVSFETICDHEAAHAAMRWVVGLPPTKVEANEHGGCCHGTGEIVNVEDNILVTLAGFACESGYGLGKVNFATSDCVDFDVVRKMLDQNMHLRVFFDFKEGSMPPVGVELDIRDFLLPVEDALSRWFDRACERLCPFSDLVEMISEELQLKHVLSADEISAIRKEYEQQIDESDAA